MNKADRVELEAAITLLGKARDIIQGLAEREEEKYDNLSEGLQNAERGQRMQEVAEELEDCASEIEDIESRLSDAQS